jgi:hypothetical protein
MQHPSQQQSYALTGTRITLAFLCWALFFLASAHTALATFTTFTTAGGTTWTAPAGVYSVTAEAWGGGCSNYAKPIALATVDTLAMRYDGK